MTHTVVIWNIEKYGSFRSFGGHYYPGRNRFIRHLLEYLDADALIIQEFKQAGIQKLADLCADMGAGWHYDYLPGAFRTDPTAAGNNANTFTMADLCYGSNAEGYAVLWQTDRLGHVTPTMSRGRDNGAGGNYISLNITGVKPDVLPGTDVVFEYPAHRHTKIAGYPTSSSPVVVNPNKRPRQSSRLAVDYRAKYEKTKNENMLTTQSRRPCYVNFTTTAHRTVPIVVYHNPVENPASLHGAQLCGLTEHVAYSEAARYPRLIVGGDFNLSNTNDRTNGFYNIEHYDMELFGDHTRPYEASSIHYYVGIFPRSPVASPNNVNSYLGSERDQWFSRGITHPANTTGVLNLIELLSNPSNAQENAFVRDVLRDVRIKTMVDNVTPDGIMFLTLMAPWNALYTNLKGRFRPTANTFNSPMSVGMFFKGYISDHLPLVVTFDP